MLELKSSLKNLGVSGKVKVLKIDGSIFKVFVNGLYFGIYSNIKKTFVD